MAAYKSGIEKVIVPQLNLPDLDEIDGEVKKSLKFIPAETMKDVLAVALKEL